MWFQYFCYLCKRFAALGIILTRIFEITKEHTMIDTRLKVFRSVATLLSFTKAANELFISQPAISKHIQELEKEYGVQLFDRESRH